MSRFSMRCAQRSALLVLGPVLGLVFIFGCNVNAKAPATLTLAFGTAGPTASTRAAGSSSRDGSQVPSARAFGPAGAVISSIKVEATGPQGARLSAESTDCAPIDLELAPGEWVITARGRNAAGLDLASGFLELALSPSEKLSRDLVLTPIAGSGSLALDWNLSGSLTGELWVEGRLVGADGSEKPISAPFSTACLRLDELSSGSWRLELKLLCDGSPVCGLAEAILVAGGMETTASVQFKPPEASLALRFVLPDYSSLNLAVEPPSRRASRDLELSFRAQREQANSGYAWYAEGSPLAAQGSSALFRVADLSFLQGASEARVDCLRVAFSPPRSGSARARFEDGASLGPLAWGELVSKAELVALAPESGAKALGDARDLAWSADSHFLAVAGRSQAAVGIFEATAPGMVFALSPATSVDRNGPAAPSLLRFLPNGRQLCISDADGRACSLENAENGPGIVRASLADPSLVATKDLALDASGRMAYLASQGSDAILLLRLSAEGDPIEVSVAASKTDAGLASLSKPLALALSATGGLLAMGSAGDDAIYLFNRDQGTGALSLAQRIDKSVFPVASPLSDPCSLAFSPDGLSLFVLSYYGKSLNRLESASAGGSFAVVNGLKSGSGGITGFSTPKRLALSPDGKCLAVAGGGADDGLSLFGTDGAGKLDYLGCLLPGAGPAVPVRPSCLAFSPDGMKLALASDGFLSLFALR